MNKWISVKDKLPEDGQEVLTYYYDTVAERDMVLLLNYFEKDAVMYTKIDRDSRKTKAQRMLNTVFNSELEVRAREDGFHIFEWDERGDTCCRKHADIITHWMPLPAPPEVE